MYINIGIIWITKLISRTAKTLNLGAGSTWPGHIALRLNPQFTTQMLEKNKVKVILIAGTNGKTTTATLLRFLLENNGIRVFQNRSGANLQNGLASSLITHADSTGTIPYDVALFETDENALPHVLGQMHPDAILLLNLFRDQLDRYGELNTIIDKWRKAFAKLPKKTMLIANGDDPQLSYLAKKSGLAYHFFGIDEKEMSKKELSHDVDFLYCPNCKTRLSFLKTSYSHMGIFVCPNCGHKREKITVLKNLPKVLLGKYNMYNTQAAAFTAHTLFDIPTDTIAGILPSFKPAFGRQEHINYKGKDVVVLLSKNPTGFNQSIEAVLDSPGKEKTVLLLLNDRIPDGRDISWIWDVDFNKLLPHTQHLFISGDRAYDMGLRIKYEQKSEMQNPKFEIEEDLKKAVTQSLKKIKENETLYILCTYSAMLEVRKIITGRKIL